MVFLAFTVHPQTTDPSPAHHDEAAEIKKLMSEIEQAFVSRDAAPFERIYLESYVGIRGRPVYNAFEPLLAMIRWDAAALKSAKKVDFETLSFENENSLVRVFGEAAVVTGVKKNLWRYRDARCLNRYQSTDLFAKLDGRWRLVLGHMTLIPCDPMPWQPPHPAVADIRSQTRPSRNLSPSVETEIREFISKIIEAGLAGGSASDAFAPDFLSTAVNNEVNSDRTPLLAALRIPTAKANERYRDDEAFLSFGGNVAVYAFRIRSHPKGPDTKPDSPITYSVIFAKLGGVWKIVSSHASTI